MYVCICIYMHKFIYLFKLNLDKDYLDAQSFTLLRSSVEKI